MIVPVHIDLALIDRRRCRLKLVGRLVLVDVILHSCPEITSVILYSSTELHA